jgi:hypothetical protein
MEVHRKGERCRWLVDNEADEGLESADLRGLTFSGENAARAVFAVPGHGLVDPKR